LLSRKIIKNWSWIDLVSVGSRQIANLLYYIDLLLLNEDIRPFLILDGINFGRHFKEYSFALQSLLFRIKNENGFAIITGQKEVPREVIYNLWLNKDSRQHIPYFSEDDIHELISLHGCNNESQIKIYTKIIQITTANGHPQLCHARVRYFQSKKWPKLSANDILSPEEITSEKEYVRQRLLDELPFKDDRNFLYRLSIFSRFFKKNVGLSLGSINPPISLPGESFERLTGPWIENVGKNLYRITPLLSGVANNIYNHEQLTKIRIAAVDAILKQKRISPFEISDALMLSLSTKSEPHLLWISSKLMTTSSEIFQHISNELFWLSYLAIKKGQKIFKDNDIINIMLRMIQYDVIAISTEKIEANEVALRCFDDIEYIDSLEIRELMEMMFYTKLLLSIGVPLDFKIVIRALLKYVSLYSKIQKKYNIFYKTEFQNGLYGSFDPVLSIIEMQFMRIKSINNLDDFITSFDLINKNDRDKIIEVFNKCDIGSIRTFISGAWTSEINKENPAFDKAIKIFEKAVKKGQEWNYELFTLIGYENISILYDEHLNEPNKAITIIDQAKNTLGSTNYVLDNQLAKVYYGKKNYEKALEIWESIFTEMGIVSKYGDFSFSKRLAANAAAYLGDWVKAVKFYELSYLSAKNAGLHILEVGALADKAFALWKDGKREEALQDLMQVVTQMNELPDPNKNLSSYMLNKRFGHMISWMTQDLSGKYLKNFLEPPPGCVSNPETNEKIKDYPLLQHLFLWFFIAEIEKGLGINLGASEKFEEERKKCKVPSIETIVTFDKVCDSFKARQFDNLIFKFKDFCYSYNISLKYKNSGVPINEPLQENGIIKSELCSDENKARLYYLLITAIASIIIKEGINRVPLTRWKYDCKKLNLLNNEITDLLNKLTDYYHLDKNKLVQIMKDNTAPNNDRLIASLMIVKEGNPDPENIYYAHVNLLMFFSNIEYNKFIEHDFADIVIKTWEGIIKNKKFALLTPLITVPEIEKAIRRPEHGMKKVALILLEALKAVNISMGSEQVKRLQKIANKQGN